MVVIDKTHFFNADGDGLFLILIPFSSKKVKKQYDPVVLLPVPFPEKVACRGLKSLSVGGPGTCRWTTHVAWALPGKW